MNAEGVIVAFGLTSAEADDFMAIMPSLVVMSGDLPKPIHDPWEEIKFILGSMAVTFVAIFVFYHLWEYTR